MIFKTSLATIQKYGNVIEKRGSRTLSFAKISAFTVFFQCYREVLDLKSWITHYDPVHLLIINPVDFGFTEIVKPNT